MLLACLVGVPLGLLLGYVPRVYSAVEVIIEFCRAIPPIVLFPIFLLLFGFGERSVVAIPAYGCVLIMLVNSSYGVAHVPELRRLVGKLYGLSPSQIYLKVVLPDALPQIVVGIRTSLSLAVVLTIVGEIIMGTKTGLGREIYNYQLNFEAPEMWVTILTAGFLGYATNLAFLRVQSRLVHWADK